MNRRQLLCGSTTAITAVLAGCTAAARTDAESPSEATDGGRTISVRKQGEVEAEPDQAVVRTSIEVSGDDAPGVRDELSERADRLRDGLVDGGLDADQITTERFRVRDRIDRRRVERARSEEKIDSEADLEAYRQYEGSHRFRIEVRAVDAVGSVVDRAIDSGADSVGRIEFTLSADRRAELRQAALELALDDARAEAEFVASEVGATVVEVQAVDTTEGRVSTVRAAADELSSHEMADDSVDADYSTAIDTDDLTVQANAAVRYRIG